MIRYRLTRRDANHAEIVQALERYGATVLDLAAVGGGCPDVLVGYRGYSYLLEIKRLGVGGMKRGSRQARTNELQATFATRWRGAPVQQVASVDEALAAVGVTRA